MISGLGSPEPRWRCCGWAKVGACQQRLGAFHASSHMIAVRRRPERLLEGAGEMAGAQACQSGELAQRDVSGYVNALSMVLAYELMRLNGDDASLGPASPPRAACPREASSPLSRMSS